MQKRKKRSTRISDAAMVPDQERRAMNARYALTHPTVCEVFSCHEVQGTIASYILPLSVVLLNVKKAALISVFPHAEKRVVGTHSDLLNFTHAKHRPILADQVKQQGSEHTMLQSS